MNTYNAPIPRDPRLRLRQGMQNRQQQAQLAHHYQEQFPQFHLLHRVPVAPSATAPSSQPVFPLTVEQEQELRNSLNALQELNATSAPPNSSVSSSSPSNSPLLHENKRLLDKITGMERMLHEYRVKMDSLKQQLRAKDQELAQWKKRYRTARDQVHREEKKSTQEQGCQTESVEHAPIKDRPLQSSSVSFDVRTLKEVLDEAFEKDIDVTLAHHFPTVLEGLENAFYKLHDKLYGQLDEDVVPADCVQEEDFERFVNAVRKVKF